MAKIKTNEEKAAYQRAYRKANREKLSAYMKTYRKANKVKASARQKEWRAEKIKTNPEKAMVTGNQIKEIRLRLRFKNQSSFASSLGISRMTLSVWERRRGNAIPQKSVPTIQSFLQYNYNLLLKNLAQGNNVQKDIEAYSSALSIIGVDSTSVPIAVEARSEVTPSPDMPVLSDQCPWCYRAVTIFADEVRSDYECRHCNREFRFRRHKGLIRLG